MKMSANAVKGFPFDEATKKITIEATNPNDEKFLGKVAEIFADGGTLTVTNKEGKVVHYKARGVR